MANLHIKKGDTVVVLSGDDKGVQGEVIATSPEEGKVIVKGVNIIHKHVKPRREGETGGIVDAEGAIYASNVARQSRKSRGEGRRGRQEDPCGGAQSVRLPGD